VKTSYYRRLLLEYTGSSIGLPVEANIYERVVQLAQHARNNVITIQRIHNSSSLDQFGKREDTWII